MRVLGVFFVSASPKLSCPANFNNKYNQKGYNYNLMVQDSKLQIPVNQKLKSALKKKADALGFSSSNEIVRVLIQNFVNGNIQLAFTTNPKEEFIPLLDLETEKNIAQSLKEIKNGDFDVLDFKKDPDALKKLLE